MHFTANALCSTQKSSNFWTPMPLQSHCLGFSKHALSLSKKTLACCSCSFVNCLFCSFIQFGELSLGLQESAYCKGSNFARVSHNSLILADNSAAISTFFPCSILLSKPSLTSFHCSPPVFSFILLIAPSTLFVLSLTLSLSSGETSFSIIFPYCKALSKTCLASSGFPFSTIAFASAIFCSL